MNSQEQDQPVSVLMTVRGSMRSPTFLADLCTHGLTQDHQIRLSNTWERSTVGVISHAPIPRVGSHTPNFFSGPALLCPHHLTQYDPIRHGNTCREQACSLSLFTLIFNKTVDRTQPHNRSNIHAYIHNQYMSLNNSNSNSNNQISIAPYASYRGAVQFNKVSSHV